MSMSGTITVTLPDEKVAMFTVTDGEIIINDGILSVWDYGLRKTFKAFSGQIGAYAKGAWLTVAFTPNL